MTKVTFIDLVLEDLFIRGLSCSDLSALTMLVALEFERTDAAPDITSFLRQYLALPGSTFLPMAPTGEHPSLTAGARDRWLAVHEAGHAIVGSKAGFTLRGVRFYGDDGFPGETGFPDDAWQGSSDEDLLRRLIRVDVAGNVAEMVCPAIRVPEGRLSVLYDDLSPGTRPSDFCSADARARHLAARLRQRTGDPVADPMMWGSTVI